MGGRDRHPRAVTGGTDLDRQGLRDALRVAYPWVDRTDWGPRSVEAGDCRRCERAPRLVPTCGPVEWTALCRDCTHEVGSAAWCDGHRDEGAAILRDVGMLPAEWGTVTVLWWVATGEVRLESLVLSPPSAPLDAGVRAALPPSR